MKKLMKFAVLASFACAMVFGLAASARAEDPIRINTASGVGINGQVMDKAVTLDLKTKAEIEAIVKNEGHRCQTLTTEDQKLACYKQIETKIRAKFESLAKDSPFFQEILRSTTFQKGTDGKYQVTVGKDVGIKKEDGVPVLRAVKGDFDIFSGRFADVIKNLEAIHTRISTLADRIDSRISKLSGEKADVAVSKKYMAAAREELRLAKVSIDSAQTTFKAESATVNTTTVTTKTDDSKEIWSVEGYTKCKLNKGVLKLDSAPPRCVLGGTVYVSESKKTDDTSETTHVATNFRAKLTKTMAHIAAAKTHLKNAHQDLVQAMSNLKPGINKVDSSVKVEATTGVN